MSYLLDTHAVVALLRNKPTSVRERYREAEAAGDYLSVSSVVLFKLWYGVKKSTRVRENTERLQIFLSGGLSAYPDSRRRCDRLAYSSMTRTKGTGPNLLGQFLDHRVLPRRSRLEPATPPFGPKLRAVPVNALR